MLRPKPGKEAIDSNASTSEELEQHPTVVIEPNAMDRLTELERALEAAKEEQEAMREELEKIRLHSQVYRDTIEDYRRQLSSAYPHNMPTPHLQTPPNTHTTEDLPRRLSHGSQSESLIDQNQKLRTRIYDLQEQIAERDDALQSVQPSQARSRSSIEWDSITVRLHNTEKESQERLQQLLDLKHSISSLTRMDNQITDSDLAERADQLYHRVREWVISNFRRTKLDFSNVPVDTLRALRAIHPYYAAIDSTDRLAFYQALLSNGIMPIFQEQLCVGLPDSGSLSSIRQLGPYIEGAGSDYREWRRTTIRALERSEAKQILEREREKLVHRIAGDIQHQFFSITSVNLPSQAQTSLISILNVAIDLQQMLLMQKAQYHIEFFRNQEAKEIVSFDDERMEPVNDIDGDGDVLVERRFFSFCVFPCLEKFGDEFGEKTDVRNILLKARVCCETR